MRVLCFDIETTGLPLNRLGVINDDKNWKTKIERVDNRFIFQSNIVTALRDDKYKLIIYEDEEREEFYSLIEKCADEYDIPLDAREQATPEQQAELLDAELEIAQCLRGKNLDVGDPSSETALRTLLQPLVFSGVITGQNLRELVRECLLENDYEVPENLREENDE